MAGFRGNFLVIIKYARDYPQLPPWKPGLSLEPGPRAAIPGGQDCLLEPRAQGCYSWKPGLFFRVWVPGAAIPWSQDYSIEPGAQGCHSSKPGLFFGAWGPGLPFLETRTFVLSLGLRATILGSQDYSLEPEAQDWHSWRARTILWSLGPRVAIPGNFTPPSGLFMHQTEFPKHTII